MKARKKQEKNSRAYNDSKFTLWVETRSIMERR